FARSRIDSPQVALVTLPGGVPELSVDPRDAGDEAVRLDGAKNLSSFGIDLMNLPISILPHPKRPLCPSETRVTATAGRGNSGEHESCLRIDFLNAILRDLEQMLAVERGSCMRGDVDRADRRSARWVEGAQLVAGRKPDVLAVVRDSADVGAWKGAVLTEDLGG